MKKLAIIIASRNFRDEEYFETKQFLSSYEFNIETFSDRAGLTIGRFGGESEAKSILDIDERKFDGIIFVGGGGALELLDNEASYNIAQAFNEKGKMTAAICIAPVILAKAGILKGRKATVWNSDMDKSAIRILEENGAFFMDEKSIIDSNIITANGPEAIEDFCFNILTYFKE